MMGIFKNISRLKTRAPDEKLPREWLEAQRQACMAVAKAESTKCSASSADMWEEWLGLRCILPVRQSCGQLR